MYILVSIFLCYKTGELSGGICSPAGFGKNDAITQRLLFLKLLDDLNQIGLLHLDEKKDGLEIDSLGFLLAMCARRMLITVG